MSLNMNAVTVESSKKSGEAFTTEEKVIARDSVIAVIKEIGPSPSSSEAMEKAAIAWIDTVPDRVLHTLHRCSTMQREQIFNRYHANAAVQKAMLESLLFHAEIREANIKQNKQTIQWCKAKQRKLQEIRVTSKQLRKEIKERTALADNTLIKSLVYAKEL